MIQRKKAGGFVRDQDISKSSRPELQSIVTIVRDEREALNRTIQTLRSEDRSFLEYLIIDGGSSDGTLDVIRGSRDCVDSWISEPDRGISHAFNKGVSLAKGELVAFLNAGDWYEPDTISIVQEAGKSYPDVDVFCGSIRFWEGGKQTLVCRSDPARLETETSVYHPTVFIRKSAYEKYGLYDESYRYAMDYELLLRFKQRGARFLSIDKIIANMPLDGVSYLNWYEGLREVRKARSKYFSFGNVVYHHIRAVAMNLAARALKKGGLRALYQAYWGSRNIRIENNRRRQS